MYSSASGAISPSGGRAQRVPKREPRGGGPAALIEGGEKMKTQLDRRRFLQRTFAGSAGVAFVGTPYWRAAAQVLEGPPLRDIRGIGVADPDLVELSINKNPLGPPRRAIEEVPKKMFGMTFYIMDTPL